MAVPPGPWDQTFEVGGGRSTRIRLCDGSLLAIVLKRVSDGDDIALSAGIVASAGAGGVRDLCADAADGFPRRRFRIAARVRWLRWRQRDVALRRSHVRGRRRAAVEPVPAADDGDLRREPHAQPRSVRLASRQRGPADGECGARHAARVAVRRRRHDARACRRSDGRLPVRVVRAGGRGDGVDRRALRRDGAVVAARRRECVHGEPIVARRVRPAESRRDGAVVHVQGVGDDRRAADSRIGVVPVWPRPGAAACAAMAADHGRVLRVPAVSVRQRVPVLPRKLAAPGAAERRVGSRISRR